MNLKAWSLVIKYVTQVVSGQRVAVWVVPLGKSPRGGETPFF